MSNDNIRTIYIIWSVPIPFLFCDLILETNDFDSRIIGNYTTRV